MATVSQPSARFERLLSDPEGYFRDARKESLERARLATKREAEARRRNRRRRRHPQPA